MSRLLASVLSGFFLFLPPAQAESGSESGNGGWYVGGGIGMSSDTDKDFNVFNSGGDDRSGNILLGHDSGTASFNLMAGYKFDNNVRLEGEFVSLPFEVDDVNYVPDGGQQGAGTVGYRAAIVNVFYDFDTGYRWTPYVGVGAGLVHLDTDTQVSVVDATAPGGRRAFPGSGSDTAEIAQFQAGIDFDIDSRFTVFANYRWALIGEFSVDNYVGPSILDTGSFNVSNWRIGLKVKLGK